MTCWPAVKDKLKELMAQDEAPDSICRQRAHGHHGGRRQRRRQDHVDRQAGLLVSVAGKDRRAGRGRHVSRGGRRAVDHLGRPPGGRRSSRASRGAIRPAWPIGPWPWRSSRRRDVCIVDTAGRLQTQQNLMQQLTKIHRVIGKQIPAAPHEVLLVLDATTGQNGISQARHFTDAVNCTGIVLGKARRHGQGRRGRGDSPAGRFAGQIRGRRRTSRRSGPVRSRRFRRGAFRRPCRTKGPIAHVRSGSATPVFIAPKRAVGRRRRPVERCRQRISGTGRRAFQRRCQ